MRASIVHYLLFFIYTQHEQMSQKQPKNVILTGAKAD